MSSIRLKIVLFFRGGRLLALYRYMAFVAFVKREALHAVMAVRRAAELPVHIQPHCYLVGAEGRLEYLRVARGALVLLLMACVRKLDRAYPGLISAGALRVDNDIAISPDAPADTTGEIRRAAIITNKLLYIRACYLFLLARFFGDVWHRVQSVSGKAILL